MVLLILILISLVWMDSMKLYPVLFHTRDLYAPTSRHVLFAIFPEFELYIAPPSTSNGSTLNLFAVPNSYPHSLENRIQEYKDRLWDLVKNHNLAEIVNLYGLTKNI